VRSGRLAEFIEKGEEEDAEGGADERVNQEAESKKWRGMIEESALGDSEDGLMKMEEEKDESESAEGMLGVDAAADRGGDKSDDTLGDAVHADGAVVAQAVLEKTDGRAEKHSGNRVAAAEAEIDGDEKREIEKLGEAAVFVKKSLKNQSQKSDNENRAAIKFVDFDIAFGLRAGIEHERHNQLGEAAG